MNFPYQFKSHQKPTYTHIFFICRCCCRHSFKKLSNQLQSMRKDALVHAPKLPPAAGAIVIYEYRNCWKWNMSRLHVFNPVRFITACRQESLGRKTRAWNP